MANYREQAITGSKWLRSNKVTINNPFQGIPQITFSEEEITLLSDGRAVNSPAGLLEKTFETPEGSFNLVNPVDGSVIGTSSYQDVYVILHSLYISLAQARDSQE